MVNPHRTVMAIISQAAKEVVVGMEVDGDEGKVEEASGALALETHQRTETHLARLAIRRSTLRLPLFDHPTSRLLPHPSSFRNYLTTILDAPNPSEAKRDPRSLVSPDPEQEQDLYPRLNLRSRRPRYPPIVDQLDEQLSNKAPSSLNLNSRKLRTKKPQTGPKRRNDQSRKRTT